MTRPASVFIDGTLVSLQDGSLLIENRIEERSTASIIVLDTAGTASYTRGQPVAVYSGEIASPSGTPVFTGFIDTPERERLSASGQLLHGITCMDNHYLADKRVAAKIYEDKTAAYIVADLITSYLAAEGITAGTIDTGETFTRVVANYVPVTDVITALADACGFIWYIDVNKALQFIDRETNIAPFAITTSVMLDDPKPRLSGGNPQYRNRQYIRGGTALTSLQTENFTGDGVQQSFACGFPIQQVPTITEDASPMTVGIKGIDTGKDYYWSKDDNVIYADTAPGDTVAVQVQYYGKYKIISLVSDEKEIDTQQTVEGVGTGYVEDVIFDTNISSRNEAFEVGQGKLTEYCRGAERLSFSTRTAGLEPGQLATVTYSAFGFSAHEMLIESVSIEESGGELIYSVIAITGPKKGSWTKLFKSLAGQAQNVIKLGDDEKVILLIQQAETLALTEDTEEFTDAIAGGIVNRWLNSAPIDSGSLDHVQHEILDLEESASDTFEYTEEYAWE